MPTNEYHLSMCVYVYYFQIPTAEICNFSVFNYRK